ncbi:MAG: MBL fold metallo-hydrolase [Rubrimonas sp.]|uniref:MBL fold metallo-hydrolase n=1 Tax=Rubrimonas sp. TaxID=2036015 RepID=UPI002FDD9AB1
MSPRDLPGLRTPFEPPAPGGASAVAEGVLWLRLPLPMRLDHVNCYALDDGDGWTLVDTGLNWRGCRAGWEALLAGPLAGRPVRRLIVTHHHPDHMGLAGWLIARGAELWTTRTAWLYARMLQLDHQERPSPEAVAFRRRAGLDAERLRAYAEAEPFNFSRTVARLPEGFRRIAEGDAVEAGGRRWRVVCGGGHAPEHATLWSEDGELALTGDQILPRISSHIGVYPSEPEADPLSDWLDSCRRLSGLADDARLALPGHNAPFTGLPLRLRQLIENHEGALERLRAHIAQAPRSAADCLGALFRREIGEAEYGLALTEAVAHLNHLRARGEAVAAVDAFGALRFSPAT